jgi:hypothetical protein
MRTWFGRIIVTGSLIVALQGEVALAQKEGAGKRPAGSASSSTAKKKVFSDPKDAGPDFAIQGEYAGKAPGGTDIAIQVIADGGGKFKTRFFNGGLPGAGWDGMTSGKLLPARIQDGKAVIDLASDKGSGVIGDSKIILKKAKTNESATLSQVHRQSPTLGAKPPEGAIVLFDGTSADEWKGGKLVEGNLLNNGIVSKKAFKDHKIHLEFILPFMPYARGQGRANSGVYIQNRYELQILDSFGLKGENNECGGLYTQYAPLVNMCYPPLSWQTYDIDFKAARFDSSGKKTADAVATILHNGVLIQDHVKLKGPTPAGQKEEDTPGPIQLQNHGNPVYFRNIWVVEMK